MTKQDKILVILKEWKEQRFNEADCHTINQSNKLNEVNLINDFRDLLTDTYFLNECYQVATSKVVEE